MTPDNPHPRKRRRRRRRAGVAGSGNPPDGNVAQPNGNMAYQNDQQYPGGPGGGGRRRRRSRRRNRGGGGGMPPGAEMPSAPPIDVAPGELVPASGVLWIKPNGTGMLVQPQNNYVPTPGDSIVPRSIVEKLHLQAGLHLSGSSRRAGNNLEFIGLEQVEGMSLEEFRESRRPFSELISIDPNHMFKLETEPARLTTPVLDPLVPPGRVQRCLVVPAHKA